MNKNTENTIECGNKTERDAGSESCSSGLLDRLRRLETTLRLELHGSDADTVRDAMNAMQKPKWTRFADCPQIPDDAEVVAFACSNKCDTGGVSRSRMNRAAQQLGRLGGKATSEAKTRAARENAKLGGWPKGKKRKRALARKRRPRKSNNRTEVIRDS